MDRLGTEITMTIRYRNSEKDRRECYIRCRQTDHLGRTILVCHICRGLPILPAQEDWECDHVTPRAHGGVGTLPAHVHCHREKTSKTDIPAIAKGKRVRDRTYGIKRAGASMPGSRRSGWKKKMDGTWERRQ